MQQDYIMRIVEQLVQAIASIMQRRKAGEYKEARQQVHTAIRYLLRVDLDLLLLYDDDYLIDHFTDFTSYFETEKCVFGADLFYELALTRIFITKIRVTFFPRKRLPLDS